jgi:hypothetical protein
MKKTILILLFVLAASNVLSLEDWTYKGNLEGAEIDNTGRSFVEVDSNGLIWSCRYDLHGVDVFNPDGTRAFSLTGPIMTAKDESGTDVSIKNPSGLAIHGGIVYVAIDDRSMPFYTGIVRLNEVDGTPLNGFNLAWRPSDIDVCSSGSMVVGVKVEGNLRMMDLSGNELYTIVTGQKLIRGVCFSNDANTIYVCGEENTYVPGSSEHFGKFVRSDGFSNYTVISTSIIGPMAVNVDSGDNVYVCEASPSYDPNTVLPPHHIYIYDNTDTLVKTLDDSVLENPCGVAFGTSGTGGPLMYVSLLSSHPYVVKYGPPILAVNFPWDQFE